MSESTSAPAEAGLEPLRQLIHRAARGELAIDAFARQARAQHERIERAGRPAYRSKEEARLIWDVLWAVEYFSPNPAAESRPGEWNDASAVLAEVRRASQRLAEL